MSTLASGAMKSFRAGHRVKRLEPFVLLNTVVLTLLVVVAFYPLLWMLLNSFKTNLEIFTNTLRLPQHVDPAVFVQAWDKAHLGLAFRNSIVSTAATVAIIVGVSALAAYPLSRMRFRGRSAILLIFISGQIVSAQIALIPLFVIFKQLRLLDDLWSLILANAAFGVPLSVLLFWNFFSDVPFELDESAKMDGCRSLRFFVSILLPLSRPALSSVAIFQGLFAWNQFLFALTFLKNPSAATIPLQIQAFFGQYAADWPRLMATLTMSILPLVVLFLALQRWFIRGLTAGAIKG